MRFDGGLFMGFGFRVSLGLPLELLKAPPAFRVWGFGGLWFRD